MKKVPKITIVSFVILMLVVTGTFLFAQDPMDAGRTNVTFSGPGGVTLKGYLATPSGQGPFPAVLMIHEWWGLNQDITMLADALASEGYVVLAADAFRGSVANTVSGARKQVTTTPSEQIAADLDASLDYLKSHRLVKSDSVASLGFCFGGTQSMYMGTRRTDLASVVIFYGGGPITDTKTLGKMKGPVLGIYGQEDNNIPIDQVLQFADAMTEKGVENTVTLYPKVGHAFVKSNTYQKGGSPERAWEQMLDFLDRNLKG